MHFCEETYRAERLERKELAQNGCEFCEGRAQATDTERTVMVSQGQKGSWSQKGNTGVCMGEDSQEVPRLCQTALTQQQSNNQRLRQIP